MGKLELLAEKYSEKIAGGFDMADIKMLERICKVMKKVENKLATLVAAERAIASGLKRVAVCLVERDTMTLVLIKSYFASCTFEAKNLLVSEYASALVTNHNLFVMKY